jgi:hypothetical protein
MTLPVTHITLPIDFITINNHDAMKILRYINSQNIFSDYIHIQLKIVPTGATALNIVIRNVSTHTVIRFHIGLLSDLSIVITDDQIPYVIDSTYESCDSPKQLTTLRATVYCDEWLSSTPTITLLFKKKLDSFDYVRMI